MKNERTLKQMIALAACAIATELNNSGRRDDFQIIQAWFDELGVPPQFFSNAGGTKGYFTYTEEQLEDIEKDFVPALTYIKMR